MIITLDGEPMGKQDLFWNLFLFKVIVKAASVLKGPQLRQALLVNFVEGENTVAGYRYIPEAGLSVQGADANYAWMSTRWPDPNRAYGRISNIVAVTALYRSAAGQMPA